VIVFVIECKMIVCYRMHWNKNSSMSFAIICRFYFAVILLLSFSLTFESETKCETCRDLVKHFKEVL